MARDTLPSTAPWVRRLRPLAWGGAAALLLAPWVAMRFTGEVAWTISDFALFGALLLVACVAFETVARAAHGPAYLAAGVVAIGAAFLLVWANLAVDIVDGPEHPANRMQAGVLLVGIAGALLARLRPRGMARTLVAMAAMQAVAGGVALWLDAREPAAFVLAFTGLYVAAWLLSAALFRKAADARR